MSIPETTSIGNTRWSQSEDEIEIQITFSPEDNIKPRELSVEVKDGEILIVSQGEQRLIQWRLYGGIKEEVEWQLEDSNKLVVGATKKSAALWSSLVMLPMKDDDELLVPLETINRMFTAQLPVLPTPQEEDEKKREAKEEGAADAEEDLDKLLDEAANEVKKPESEETGYAAYIKAELENFKSEAAEIASKLTEVSAEMELGNPSEETVTKKDILTEMLRIHNVVRELRSQPSSLENLIKCTLLDLQKARVNIGAKEEEEIEEYKTEEEKTMTATELMSRGLELFQTDTQQTLHLLRLAAVQHKHDTSIILLYDIYSQFGSPRGAYMLLKRALDDENPSAIANHKVGELYDEGAHHFLPLFPAAIYFYQRAAKLGHTNAMLSLAQMWLRGSTATSMLSEDDMEAQKDMAKYHAWLQKGIDRGSGSALFVKGCMYIKGEHGMTKSYEKAKELIDSATGAQPQLSQSAPQILMMLEQLRQEEGSSTSTKATTSAPESRVARQPASSASEKATKRLNALTQGIPSNQASTANRAKPGSAKRKQFWERAAVVGTVCYGVYTLAFPLRAVLLPFFYGIVSSLTEFIPWLGNNNFDSNLLGF